MKTALVFRFSAMGDVALTLPALLSVLEAQPDLRIVMVTRKRFAPFFAGQDRLDVFPCDFDAVHRGPAGLWRLFKELKAFSPDYLIDLHQNLRTAVLKSLFALSGVRIAHLDKQRSAKKAIIKGTRTAPLPHITEQYKAVFRQVGLETSSTAPSLPMIKTGAAVNRERSGPFLGIAPFAQHKGKIWPLEKYSVTRNIRSCYLGEDKKKKNYWTLCRENAASIR
jgi:ADP-heptose:LPS heptosyltransferase